MYLGHVTGDELKIDLAKIKAILKWSKSINFMILDFYNERYLIFKTVHNVIFICANTTTCYNN